MLHATPDIMAWVVPLRTVPITLIPIDFVGNVVALYGDGLSVEVETKGAILEVEASALDVFQDLVYLVGV
jgi:hypothetical protein